MEAVANHALELTLETTSPEQAKTNIVVLGVFSQGPQPSSFQKCDRAAQGRLSRIVDLGDLDERPGGTLLLHDVPGIAADRVLLVSLGKRGQFGDAAFRAAIGSAARFLGTGAAKQATVACTDVEPPGRSLAWRLQQASLLLGDGSYRFTPVRSANRTKELCRGANRIALLIAGTVTSALEDAVRRGCAIAEGMALAKDLGNMPGNVCHPPYLAEIAQALGREFGFDVEVLERDDMNELGMGAALAVGQASYQPCKFIVMHYPGDNVTTRPIVLVGKGVTFETGGISLKPGANMDEMKFDMCGAASVFGAIKMAARLRLPIGVVGIVPAVENMPGGNATRPGDVVTSMSGQTIEILNTDAEGRLALADALTYAERYDPACVIDVATLTGASVIALGNVTSALLANDDQLARELLHCSDESGDRAWQLPMFDEYQEQLRSHVADMSNLGGRAAGTITAACFLARFARAYKWAHLDIAGTGATSGETKGATGRPVPLLSEFLMGRASRTAHQLG